MNIAAGADIKEMINRPFHETFGGRFLEVRIAWISRLTVECETVIHSVRIIRTTTQGKVFNKTDKKREKGKVTSALRVVEAWFL